METQSPWMNGNTANSQLAAASTVANMATAIFGSIGANTYVQHYSFNPADVVVEETQRDNFALLTAGATVLLLLLMVIVILR